ncbi:MAG: HAD-IIB family hydrolase, partial [Lachnospiraceae bacterium]|nr:HAD-IIB family hydrolase [Lachnospiraceae bacterium]
MNRKLVFFDVDGTIWDWKRVVPDSAREAVRRMRENGHMAFICSGRAKGNLRAPWLLDIGFDGMVAACGAYVELEGEILYNRIIEQSQVKKTVDVLNRCKMPFVLEGPQKHWVSNWGFDRDDYVANLYELLKDDAVTIGGYTEGIEINKFSADILGMTDYREIRATLDDYFDFIEHGVTPDLLLASEHKGKPLEILGVIEAVPKGLSKGVGLKLVCEKLGIAPEDTIAVGDSVNDLEMFETAGTAIAMGNATEAAKQAADWITTDIHEDGVLNA